MKRKNLLKVGLLAAGLLVGTNVWAGNVSAIYTKVLGDATNGWSSADVTKTEGTTSKWYNSTGIVANDYLTGMMVSETLGLRLCARQTTATTSLTLNRSANTIVTIDAVWNTGSESYPNNSNCNSFIYGDFKFDFYTRYKTTQYTINGTTKNASASCAADEDLNIHLVVNSVSGEISELKVSKADNAETVYVQLSDLTSTNNTFATGTNYDVVTIQSINNVSKNYNYTSLKSITVKEETQDVPTTSVTFKYVDTEGNDLSAYQEYQIQTDVAVGAEISGLINNHTNTFYNGTSNKYIYSGDYTVEGNYTTVQSTGNVVTLKFTDYPATDYVVVAQYNGSDIASVATGNGFIDGSVTAYFSKFAQKDGEWYETTKPYNLSVTETKMTVSYTKMDGDVIFCSEAEKIEGLTTWAFSNYVGNMSNGNSAVLDNTKITTLEAGTYTITACAIGRANDRYIDFYKGTVDDSNKILRVVSTNAGGVNSATFTLTEATDIVGTGGSAGGANGHACDYIYIVKLPSTVSATTGANGYATFASPYALDLSNLPNGLKAYKASISGTTVTFTEVNEAVKANTGLLLQGNAESSPYSIPVTVSDNDISASNAFLVNTDGTTFTGDNDYYYFGLKANTLTFGLFDPSAVAIPANKAYLKVAKSDVDGAGARALKVAFGDETTGINTVETAGQTNGHTYNLSGQRVAAPQRGLYIVNGKKVIIK